MTVTLRRSSEDELIADIAGFFDDPLGFVRYAYPWGEAGRLKDETGPDEWQTAALRKLGEAVRAGGDASEAIRLAVASGHGIGKTAVIAWIIQWFLSTREFPQVVVTASTQTQLTTKTWRELSKWHRLLINAHWFRWTATKFFHVAYPETWFASAIPWSEHNADAFAGTHEKYVLIIYDEGNAVADVIWDTTEGALTTPGAIWAGTRVGFMSASPAAPATGRYACKSTAARRRRRTTNRSSNGSMTTARTAISF